MVSNLVCYWAKMNQNVAVKNIVSSPQHLAHSVRWLLSCKQWTLSMHPNCCKLPYVVAHPEQRVNHHNKNGILYASVTINLAPSQLTKLDKLGRQGEVVIFEVYPRQVSANGWPKIGWVHLQFACFWWQKLLGTRSFNQEASAECLPMANRSTLLVAPVTRRNHSLSIDQIRIEVRLTNHQHTAVLMLNVCRQLINNWPLPLGLPSTWIQFPDDEQPPPDTGATDNLSWMWSNVCSTC